MANDWLMRVLQMEIKVFLLLLVTLLCFEMLRGKINTRGLFRDKITGILSPGRIQGFVTTLMGMGAYFVHVLEKPSHFPEIPPTLLGLFGISHTVYLGEKWISGMLNNPRHKDEIEQPSFYLHEVSSGENLLQIANRYGISLEELVEHNVDQLKPGSHLHIPVTEEKITLKKRTK